MIVGIVAAQVLSWHVLHLVVELVSIIPSFRKEDAHAVCPIINEQQSRSEVHRIVIDPSKCVVIGIC